MKKRIIILVAIAVLSIAVTACSKKEVKENQEQNIDPTSEDPTEEKPTVISPTGVTVTVPVYELNEVGIIKPEVAQEAISDITAKVIAAISTKDFKTMADYVHPEKGVRFTPYANVSVDKDVVLSKDEIMNFFENQTKYLWGNYDGSGFEISLTPSQYYDEFIYTSDFLNAEEVGYNEVLGSGNIIENQFDVYENAIVVEYYFSGFDPNYGGADWQSLRLVYELYNNEWKLVGIIHNQFTI
jgi:hypothetical protein